MRVLVAEDERVLAELVAAGLRAEAMAVDVAYDGLAAHERLAVHDYDVLVLDRDLPGMGGDELCRYAVARSPGTRILILTAAASLDERVQGLDLGADDYLTKPFDYPELAARVRALGRRAVRARPPVLRAAGVELDPATRRVTRDGVALALAPKEFAVLAELLAAGGAVVSAEHLLERVWDEHADPFTSAVKVTVSKLRAKLGEPAVIETVPGAGYRI